MEDRASKRKWPMIIGLLLLATVAIGFFVTREPATPYPFLNRFPIVERIKPDDSNRRGIILNADFEDVWRAIQSDFGSGARGVMTSSGMSSMNGIVVQTRGMATEDGMINITTDLDGASKEGGFAPPRLKHGYCLVIYSRPKSIFDRAMDWIANLFGPKPQAAPAPTSGPLIRV